MSIFVNKELRDLIPPLSEEEYAQLEQNIVAEGIRDPLVVWKQPDGREMLIDGHNRWSIAAHHSGITFDVVYKDFADLDEAKVWIIDNQLGQRNLPPYSKTVLHLKKKEILASYADKGGRPPKKPTQIFGQVSEKKDRHKTSTNAKIGELAGVSEETVRKVQAIEEKATDRTKQLVREGKLSINQAYNSVHPKRVDPVKEMVKEAREKHAEYLEEKKARTVDFVKAQEDRSNQSIIRKETMIEIHKLLDAVENFGFLHKPEDLIGIVNDVDETEREMIMDRCNTCKGILSRIQIAFINE